MTFTATPSTHRFSGSYGCNGLNHTDSGVAGHCDNCGTPVFKAAKGQLTEIGRNTNGAQVFQCWRAHHCDPKYVAQRDLRDAETLVAGNFPKEVEVEVFKGRKVPVGTAGIVRWIGEGSYLPGSQRLGLAVEGQTKLVYVDAANCRVSDETMAAAQATVAADQAQRQELAARMDALLAERDELRKGEAAIDEQFFQVRDHGTIEQKTQFRDEVLLPHHERISQNTQAIKALETERGY